MIDLKSISKNSPKKPRIAIYGPPGIGKTTFAANSEDPVFVLTEDGLGDLEVAALPQDESGNPRASKSFEEVLSCLEALGTQDHEYKTVIIDSLDALEPLVWAATCKRNGDVPSIEKVGGGYGKGYIEANTEWKMLLDYLTALRDEKGITVVLIAHSAFTHVDDPEHPAYDTNTLKLHKRASGLVTEWCDIVGFASYRVVVRVDDKGKRARALEKTQEHVLRIVGSPAVTAKNRYHMPDSVPLVWESFAEHLPKGGK